MADPPVVIVGGGYGGLAALRRLSRLPGHPGPALVIDSSEAHSIKTRFYEIAVSPARNLFVRFSIPALARAAGSEYLCAEVVHVDFERRVVVTGDGERAYRALILAPGARAAWSGVEGAASFAVHLQTYEAAVQGGRRVDALLAGPAPRRVVVCGAGLEGLEIAAMLRQRAGRSGCEIAVVDAQDKLMERSQCRDAERAYVARHLDANRIGLRLGMPVRRVGLHEVELASGEVLPAELVFWSGGIAPARIGGAPAGPFEVNDYLQSPDHPEVFAVGDYARADSPEPWANLASAQRALYQGGLAAENAARLLEGRPLLRAEYRPAGELVALGDFDGVGVVGGFGIRGLPAALAKRAVEARYLSELLGQVPRHLFRTAVSG